MRDDGDRTIEGEWKDGQLDGKVIEKWKEDSDEYEAKDGKINGKFIRYWNNGGCE